MPRFVLVLAHDGDAAHVAMHIDCVAHHHEADGSIQKGSSTKSLKHTSQKTPDSAQMAGSHSYSGIP